MKHRVNVTVDKDNYQALSAAGVNISGLVIDVVSKGARRIKAEQWKEDNREGMEEVARFIVQNGPFADENRDGRSSNSLFINTSEPAITKCLLMCKVILSIRPSDAGLFN